MAESWRFAGPRGTAHHADRQRDQCAQEDEHHQRPQEPIPGPQDHGPLPHHIPCIALPSCYIAG